MINREILFVIIVSRNFRIEIFQPDKQLTISLNQSDHLRCDFTNLANFFSQTMDITSRFMKLVESNSSGRSRPRTRSRPLPNEFLKAASSLVG